MKLRLSTWNWIQLLLPQLIAVVFLFVGESTSESIMVLFFKIIYLLFDFFLPNGDFSYWRCLAAASIAMVLGMIAPFMSYKEKTGRSFKTKHATYDEYRTVESKFQADSMNYFYIMLLHILIVVVYYYTADKTEDKINLDNTLKTEESINSEGEGSYSSDSNSSSSNESDSLNVDSDNYSNEGNYQNDADQEGNFNINESSTITIGDQIWLNRNFDSKTFSNGDEIPQAKNEQEWIDFYEKRLPCWGYLHFDNSNQNVGKIYNWFAVFDERGLAPSGWKIPNQNDWNTLTEYYGGINEAGKQLTNKNEFNGKFYGQLESGINSKGELEISTAVDRTNWWSSDKTTSFVNNKGDKEIHYLTKGRLIIQGSKYFHDDPMGEADGGFIRLVKKN
jgi:uncharacterized protein (TIGR02145 family)